jgi:hypothetical protein
VGLKTSAGLLTAFPAAIFSPRVLVPLPIGMMVSDFVFALSFNLYTPKYLIINIGYVVINTTNICWKKIALQLEVNMGKFATGTYGTGLSFRLVCGFDIG